MLEEQEVVVEGADAGGAEVDLGSLRRAEGVVCLDQVNKSELRIHYCA